MARFDDECEYWGQETPEPNLITPLRPDDTASVRQALAVVETLMRLHHFPPIFPIKSRLQRPQRASTPFRNRSSRNRAANEDCLCEVVGSAVSQVRYRNPRRTTCWFQ